MESEQEVIREVMRVLGSRRTPAKAEANRRKQPLAVAASVTPEARQKRSQAQKERREREKAAREPADMTTPKRARGRPRKQEKGEGD